MNPSAEIETDPRIDPQELDVYTDSLEHVVDELARLDFLIRLQISQVQQSPMADESNLRGFHISDPEIMALLETPLGTPRWAARPGLFPAGHPQVGDLLSPITENLARRKVKSRQQGVELRLDELIRRFGLSAFELDVLLLCLAPEIDLRYERLFAYLQDDLNHKRPCVDLVLSLLCSDFGDKLAGRRYFGSDAPLVRHRLIEWLGDANRSAPPWLARELKVDERVVDYLFGTDSLDVRLRPWARCFEPTARLEDLIYPEELERRLRRFASGSEGAPQVLYLQGPSGVGKATVAEAICRWRGLKLLRLDVAALIKASSAELKLALELTFREAILQGAALLFEGADPWFADGAKLHRALFLGRLAEVPGPSFLTATAPWEPGDALGKASFTRLELPLPSYRQRLELWSRALSSATPPTSELETLAARFRLSGAQIRAAAATALQLADDREPKAAGVTVADLQAACRLHSNRRLSSLGRKMTPRYRWRDLVLPADLGDQLREICATVQHRGRVLDEWGFDSKLSLGKGIGVLFAGPSGTGKTMAAEVLASELGLDLYKIDLATVVSKYIGETEKHLSQIFDEAETSNAILFFDEADALFGKRSEVRDSHDRYANLEVSYLLQRIEAYEGIVVLATNLRSHLDEAFIRRLQFTLEFTFPDEKVRRAIWQGIWPGATPRDPQLDLDLMARRFDVAGGNIKNIALAAAFLAADNGGCVGLNQLLHATRREYQKMGRMAVDGEFDSQVGK